MMDIFSSLLLAGLGGVVGYLAHKPRIEVLAPPAPDYRPLQSAVQQLDAAIAKAEAAGDRWLTHHCVADRVEIPVLVDRPVIERVEVERVVEKPVIERVAVPMGSSSLTVPDAVDVVLMDASEQNVHATARIDARLRRSMITANDQKYQCSKQDECGRWIYRQVTH